jgi:sugar phosphate isomerase/epimerase
MGGGDFTLHDLPAELAAKGYYRCELCHFHLANQKQEYLADLGARFRAAGVVIQTLLIDDGDISNPATRDRDLAWTKAWIDSAGWLGAEHARVIAGKQKPTVEALSLSVEGLKQLVGFGLDKGVRIVTENWFDLLATPREVHHVLDAVGDGLGFLADTGNWSGPTKYADLQSIFGRAELCHAKTGFSAGLKINGEDYRACMMAAKAANYKGPYTLIFDDEGDEWQGLGLERDFIAAL